MEIPAVKYVEFVEGGMEITTLKKIKAEGKKYYAENYEEIKTYRKQCNQREKECEVCNCEVKVSGWARHCRTQKHLENIKWCDHKQNYPNIIYVILWWSLCDDVVAVLNDIQLDFFMIFDVKTVV